MKTVLLIAIIYLSIGTVADIFATAFNGILITREDRFEDTMDFEDHMKVTFLYPGIGFLKMKMKLAEFIFRKGCKK